MKYIKWGVALLLSVFFIFMGVQKFGSENLIFYTIAERSGIELFEPTIRMLVGISELIAAILLILPATRRLQGSLGLYWGWVYFSVQSVFICHLGLAFP
jgi:hypothetical protein